MEASVTTTTATPNVHATAQLQLRRYHPATEIVMVDNVDSESGESHYNASSMPIYQTATFKQSSASQMGEYDYSRSGNPTRSYIGMQLFNCWRQVSWSNPLIESHLAKIMRAHRAFVVTSGMSALDMITRLVRSGQDIIAGDDIYGGTNRLLTHLSRNNQIGVHHVDTTSIDAILARCVPGQTAMVLLETPTNPLIKIADIRGICDRVHAQCPECLIVVDSKCFRRYYSSGSILFCLNC